MDLAGWEAGGGGEDSLVAGVEGGTQEEDGGDASDYLGEVLGFVLVEGAAEEGVFAVAEPLLEDLVAAEGVVPDVDGDGGPEGFAIQVDVDAGFSEEGDGLVEGEGVGGFEDGEFFTLFAGPFALGEFASSGHDGAALTSAAP